MNFVLFFLRLRVSLYKLILKINVNNIKYSSSPSVSWRRSDVFIVNFEHISHLVLVSIVNFKQVNTGWVIIRISAQHLLSASLD